MLIDYNKMHVNSQLRLFW